MNANGRATRIASIAIIGVALVSGGYVALLKLSEFRAGQAAEDARRRLMFKHVKISLETVGMVLTQSNTRFDSWEQVYRKCKGFFLVVTSPNAPNPFPVSFTGQCRFGRVRTLPDGLSPERTPLIWHLAEFPPGFTMLDEYDPIGGKYDRKEGKTVVVFWNGELRYMPLSDVEKSLSALLRERPEISLFVLDRWQESGEPLWRELKWDRPK